MSLRSAFAWKTLQFVVIFAIELVGLAILARLLTPGEMGIFAAAMALLRFGQFIGSFGLHNVILRQDMLDLAFRRQVMGLCAVAVVVVLAIYIVVLMVTGVEGPQRILALLLPMIPLVAFSMPANAVLVRDMRFQAQFYLRLVSSVLFPAIAIPLAYAGYGPVSLAIATLVSTAVFAASSVWATGRMFFVWPSLRVKLSTLQFASTIFVLNAINEGREAAVALMIGRFAGLSQLGQYSRASELEVKANQVISETVMPVLAPHLFNKARQSVETLRFEMLRALEYVTALSWPMAVALIFLGQSLVRVLLGDQWDLAGDILSVMGLALAVRALGGILSTCVVAMKQERRLLKIAALNLVLSLVIVWLLAATNLIAMLGLLILVQWGAAGLCARILVPVMRLTGRDFWMTFWRSGAVAGCVAIGLILMDLVLPQMSALGRLGASAVVGPLSWFAGLALTKHPLLQELSILLAKMRRSKRGDLPEV